MKIKTKFNIGDSAYFMYDNSVYKVSIDTISILSTIKGTITRYGVYPHKEESIVWCTERNLFSTKEELLKSL